MKRRILIVIAALLESAAILSCHRDEPADVSDGAPPGDASSGDARGTGGAGGTAGCFADAGGCSTGSGGAAGGGSGGISGSGGTAGISGSSGSAGTGGSSGTAGSAGTGGSGGTAGKGGSGGNAGGSGGISGGGGSGGVGGSGGAAGVGGASGSGGGFDGGPGGAASDGGDSGPLFCADAGSDGGAMPDAPSMTVACVTVYDVDKATYSGPTPLTYACDGCKSTTNPLGPSSCRSANDCEMIGSGQVSGIARVCTLSCRDQEPPSGTCVAANECNRQCVKNATAMQLGAPGLSDECGKCYTHLSMCSIAYCLADCAADINSMACIACLFGAGCTLQFERCTGLDRH